MSTLKFQKKRVKKVKVLDGQLRLPGFDLGLPCGLHDSDFEREYPVWSGGVTEHGECEHCGEVVSTRGTTAHELAWLRGKGRFSDIQGCEVGRGNDSGERPSGS